MSSPLPSSSSIMTLETVIQSWFIPVDIFMITCTIVAIVLSTIFLCIIIVDRSCHTVPMMLVANSCLSVLVFACVLLSMSIFTLENDLKRIDYEDSQCIVRAYFDYVAAALVNYSFLVQALYRYTVAVYPARLFWHSAKSQLMIICITWLIGIIFPFVFIFNGKVIYNADNQICQTPVVPSFYIVYPASCIYGVPVSAIMFIYYKLLQHVHRMKCRVVPVAKLFRAQRHLKMAQQIMIVVGILLTIGFPYALFIGMTFFTKPPKYHYRIAFLFVDVSLALVIIALFQLTQPVKSFLMKRLTRRPNTQIALT
ncbi:unnamed protein product [Adineta ricciae]|uniref:G-protein coupled receptors family 1 profile domain-containing protein n=1 Tax=Adineta ricciae TaxID=249248 RepID=A0A815XAJ0_ADIRI|nr:unnamed protein product [Adineta ricciae]CAF1555069.1 unnamed protein product [Adineta ricciae]